MLGLLVERFVPYSLVCLSPGGGFLLVFAFRLVFSLMGMGSSMSVSMKGNSTISGMFITRGSVCVLVVRDFLISVFTLGGRVGVS